MIGSGPERNSPYFGFSLTEIVALRGCIGGEGGSIGRVQ
jgi:hypothetical protein